MKSRIPQRSLFAYYVFSFLTLGIYALVFWSKVSKQVNILCEGDGKKTMKFFPAWCLSVITFGIFGYVWKYKLAERLKDNAERYNLRFSEGGALVVVYYVLGKGALLTGPLLGQFILIKNFNAIANAYNEYNGLVDPEADKRANIFADSPEDEAVGA